ncbi:cytochrome c oxidase subunit II [Afifella marina]|uniref:cytochrome-c oxidase n=1 Tax=Afifella marina DSM 2698 TaxID=1120955 RepID=A0A1G5MVP7_AFIMA|nr:cytochrome c oxidase subunit II [Afifella marina]MBK1621976.1 cytochrome c oxidase subunit II [Afifella marina DSM 2698]MBK1627769.1 cytochrome c oxidase subunit II [Afifella marina]MBK5916736.1 cytochrome c oxidase subunit II [Afifella marina]RAI19937.1 cytochrome c oxidase subunit II [Afifella marina DSM 2698]SCZ28601.1 cytochrome c oxidase subunit 2 [Afifella marina DSM 2698]
MSGLSSFISAASERARQTDLLFFSATALSGFIVLLVAGLIIGFSIRYRKNSNASRAELPPPLLREFETGWTLATVLLFVTIFGWASAQGFGAMTPAGEPLQINVVAKQWMWKSEHPGGEREINELHVPADRAILLSMNSQDVIHSFFVPALRIKQDVVPGHTEALSFIADKPGTYALLCAEYCGTQHSKMTGKVIVMEEEDYADWLSHQEADNSLAAQGERLFTTLGCSGCHGHSANVRAPPLENVYGSPVALADGRIVEADDAYLRDSILQPKRDVVAGFKPIMPSFAGRVSEANLLALLAYLKKKPQQEARDD